MAGDLRNPRKRALEIGTNPAGFGDEIPYDPQGGHPITPEQSKGQYEEPPPAVGGTGEPVQTNPIGGK